MQRPALYTAAAIFAVASAAHWLRLADVAYSPHQIESYPS